MTYIQGSHLPHVPSRYTLFINTDKISKPPHTRHYTSDPPTIPPPFPLHTYHNQLVSFTLNVFPTSFIINNVPDGIPLSLPHIPIPPKPFIRFTSILSSTDLVLNPRLNDFDAQHMCGKTGPGSFCESFVNLDFVFLKRPRKDDDDEGDNDIGWSWIFW